MGKSRAGYISILIKKEVHQEFMEEKEKLPTTPAVKKVGTSDFLSLLLKRWKNAKE